MLAVKREIIGFISVGDNFRMEILHETYVLPTDLIWMAWCNKVVLSFSNAKVV